jgi:hypothetical protein
MIMMEVPFRANPTCLESLMVTEWIMYAAAFAIGWVAAGLYSRLGGR